MARAAMVRTIPLSGVDIPFNLGGDANEFSINLYDLRNALCWTSR